MNNTGYKIATKIKVVKKSDSSTSEKVYPIGKFNGSVFVPYTSEELSKLSPNEYKECVRDTKLYIMSEEEVDGDMVAVNEGMVQDYSMCPIPLPMNAISVSSEIESTGDLASENYIWLKFDARYDVASDLWISMQAEGESSFYNICRMKQGENTVKVTVNQKNSGSVAKLKLSLNEDSTYRYSIPSTVNLPKLGVLKMHFHPVFSPGDGKVSMNYISDFGSVTSDVVIRVSVIENGKESYLDIPKTVYSGSSTARYDVPANFLGKTASVRIYSVNGVVGETSDSRYKYTVDPTLDIPDILSDNKLTASVFVPEGSNPDWDSDPAYRPVLTIKSEEPVASDLSFSISNVNGKGAVLVPLPVFKAGTSELKKALPLSSKGNTITIELYEVGGVWNKGYDDKYRYWLDVDIKVPN